jgi:hypothetical protein
MGKLCTSGHSSTIYTSPDLRILLDKNSEMRLSALGAGALC